MKAPVPLNHGSLEDMVFRSTVVALQGVLPNEQQRCAVMLGWRSEEFLRNSTSRARDFVDLSLIHYSNRVG